MVFFEDAWSIGKHIGLEHNRQAVEIALSGAGKFSSSTPSARSDAGNKIVHIPIGRSSLGIGDVFIQRLNPSARNILPVVNRAS